MHECEPVSPLWDIFFTLSRCGIREFDVVHKLQMTKAFIIDSLEKTFNSTNYIINKMNWSLDMMIFHFIFILCFFFSKLASFLMPFIPNFSSSIIRQMMTITMMVWVSVFSKHFKIYAKIMAYCQITFLRKYHSFVLCLNLSYVSGILNLIKDIFIHKAC